MTFIQERRRYIRVSRSLEFRYRVLSSLLGSSSRSKNISEGGICLPLFQKLEPGTILGLEFRLEDLDRQIVATAEVVWVKERNDGEFPFEAGIKFVKIHPLDQAAIRNCITKEHPKETRWID